MYFSVSKSEVPVVYQACRILLRFLVEKLSRHRVQLGDGTPTVYTTKQLLLPIRALCMGHSFLSPAEEVALVATYIKSPPPGNEKDASQSSKDSVRIRGDLSSGILEQLTMPLQDFTLFVPLVENSNDGSNKTTNEGTNNEVWLDTKVGI